MKHGHWKLCVLAVGTVVHFGGEPTSVAEPRQVYGLRDVILDPVAVPPFLRVDLDAIELHGEVDNGRLRPFPSGRRAHDLASFDHIAFVHSNLAKVAVDRL
jgi:hypothetical protein